MAIERPRSKAIVSSPIPLWKLALIAVGPGLVVMLADTDAGSAIVAAQSGARWGYRLLLLQLLLVPILYVVQELTVRLGLVTRKGHGELITASRSPLRRPYRDLCPCLANCKIPA